VTKRQFKYAVWLLDEGQVKRFKAKLAERRRSAGSVVSELVEAWMADDGHREVPKRMSVRGPSAAHRVTPPKSFSPPHEPCRRCGHNKSSHGSLGCFGTCACNERRYEP
jgi:hypothetical protein